MFDDKVVGDNSKPIETKHNSRTRAREWPYTCHKSFVKSLREAAKLWFADQGQKTHHTMGYCLAQHDQWRNNIICQDVANYVSQEQKRRDGASFPLHRYLHHGLSSQAMVFNLIGPLVVRNDLAPLKIAMEKAQIAWPEGTVKAIFEHHDRTIFNEDSGQPTSIDLLLSGSSSHLFVEAKLVEPGFGGCSVFARGDCEGKNPFPDRLGDCYLRHIKRTYWNKLKEFGFSEVALVNGVICPFANYYQFFREATFAFANEGTFVLLHDARNPAFLKSTKDGRIHGGLWPLLYETIPDHLRNQIGRLTIQTVVESIQESRNHQDWIQDFKKKYGIQ